MSQQINLYNPALRQPREWLTATGLALAVGATLLLITLGIAGARYKMTQANAEAGLAEARLGALRTELASLNARISSHAPDSALGRQIEITRSQFRSREETLAALGTISIEPGKGFAEYLRGFARQTVRGVWLTGVSIGPGKELSIHGRTLNQSLVSEYVNRLGREPAFAGHAFARVSLGQVSESPNKSTVNPSNAAEIRPIEFSLITAPEEADSNTKTTKGLSLPPELPNGANT